MRCVQKALASLSYKNVEARNETIHFHESPEKDRFYDSGCLSIRGKPLRPAIWHIVLIQV